MDRSERTIKVMTSFIFKLVEFARPQATTFDKIPNSIQSYFPYYKMPVWSPSKAFERIYMFKNYYGLPDLQPHTSATSVSKGQAAKAAKASGSTPRKISKLRKLLGRIMDGNQKARTRMTRHSRRRVF